MIKPRILGFGLPFILWFLSADILEIIAPELLPGLQSVVRALIEGFSSGDSLLDIHATSYRWLVGFAVGASLGIAFGFLIGHSRYLKELSNMSLEFLRSLPVTALLPLFLLVLGVGDSSKIAMAAFPAMLMMVIYTEGGIRRCSENRIAMSKSFGATPWQVLRLVTVPEVLPSLLLGLRFALSLSLVVSIVAEMFIGTRLGIGQRIYEAYMLNAADMLYAHILICGFLGYISASGLQLMETRSMRWVGK